MNTEDTVTAPVLSRREGHAIFLTLNRPEQRNALSLRMVDALLEELESAGNDPAIRALVLRGTGGHFSAGADVSDMLNAQQLVERGQEDAFEKLNRRFGNLLERFERSPLVTIVALEGSIMGGGLGLACTADIAIASRNARFSLPEARLGLVPAQVAPFVVARIGQSQARRLALAGASIDAAEALRLGLVHSTVTDCAALDAAVAEQLTAVGRCAPAALATTKRLLLDSDPAAAGPGRERLLDHAARLFSRAVQGAEGREGTRAFIEKRPAGWQPQ
ncbi:enoyl-CoA hydratase/isomerase family protein [Microbulbifer yueqingensis]|uniref:Isohexenylglutaconyl-CoA hydratase n=1 Tax=Microbulbifer yueqingensis TaxID=658219 RepID=A0A1G8ZGL2_9GAMM|nr:enoyl-CoA hydratase-related protein [Microbulbifer yueqingensis]SDK13280.1 isohexenylglutaconyl-CoA hydratase [Microbulbifer yueqingensis]